MAGCNACSGFTGGRGGFVPPARTIGDMTIGVSTSVSPGVRAMNGRTVQSLGIDSLTFMFCQDPPADLPDVRIDVEGAKNVPGNQVPAGTPQISFTVFVTAPAPGTAAAFDLELKSSRAAVIDPPRPIGFGTPFKSQFSFTVTVKSRVGAFAAGDSIFVQFDIVTRQNGRAERRITQGVSIFVDP